MEIMKSIWFCHNPIDRRPCGMCRPCQQKMECGMEWLLPPKAQKRYFRYIIFRNLFGERITNKLNRFLRKVF